MNARQKRFCNEYLIDLNATQAALRAGYSQRTAAIASEWIDTDAKIRENSRFNPEMAKYIADRMAEIDDALIAKQKEILKYLTSVMRREQKDSAVVVIATEGSKYVPDEKGVSRLQKYRKEEPKIVEIPTRVSDANKAAELLGRRYGMFTDNVVASVEMPHIISNPDGSVMIDD